MDMVVKSLTGSADCINQLSRNGAVSSDPNVQTLGLQPVTHCHNRNYALHSKAAIYSLMKIVI